MNVVSSGWLFQYLGTLLSELFYFLRKYKICLRARGTASSCNTGPVAFEPTSKSSSRGSGYPSVFVHLRRMEHTWRACPQLRTAFGISAAETRSPLCASSDCSPQRTYLLRFDGRHDLSSQNGQISRRWAVAIRGNGEISSSSAKLIGEISSIASPL